jgi:hypothetical protein
MENEIDEIDEIVREVRQRRRSAKPHSSCHPCGKAKGKDQTHNEPGAILQKGFITAAKLQFRECYNDHEEKNAA